MATTKPHASFYVEPSVYAEFVEFCRVRGMKQGASFEFIWRFFQRPRVNELVARLTAGVGSERLAREELQEIVRLGRLAEAVLQREAGTNG